jgi:hypothetical protein
MSNEPALTPASVRALADTWFAKLDEHAREVEFLPLLAEEGLSQLWPDYTVKSLGDFEGWYQRALRLFFDEQHTLKEFDVTVSGDGAKADVKLVVNWQARTWNPGDPTSKQLDMDAYQTWEVTPSGKGGSPVIKTIIVDDVKVKPGSATL